MISIVITIIERYQLKKNLHESSRHVRYQILAYCEYILRIISNFLIQMSGRCVLIFINLTLFDSLRGRKNLGRFRFDGRNLFYHAI